ncbi:MAG: HAMP domain-containing histidine kinase [Bacteroidetes bacterium]|nr:HAMP domain-containing histidine kinase [Bacteroidota bacterium]
MKLKILFLLITTYVIAGILWWSYSLMKYNENDLKLKLKLLKSERQICNFKVIEEARLHKFISNKTDTFSILNFTVFADTQIVKNYVKYSFNNKYVMKYTFSKNQKLASIKLNPATLDKLNSKMNIRKRSFISEAIILIILITAGILGLYFSVSTLWELHKQQNNFLLSVTHELKTPIASIILISETLQKRILPTEKHNELLGSIIENADRLKDMTENMLTAMQIENRKFFIRKADFDLSELLKNISVSFSLKNQINTDIQDNVIFFGDIAIMKMTLNNIIENAIKYSENKPVNISLKKNENEIQIEISDFGMGIDNKYRKKIFKKFYRIEDDEIRRTTGSGLGLFIVNQAVKKHKGKIEISDNKPQGTIVKIKFKAKT